MTCLRADGAAEDDRARGEPGAMGVTSAARRNRAPRRGAHARPQPGGRGSPAPAAGEAEASA